MCQIHPFFIFFFFFRKQFLCAQVFMCKCVHMLAQELGIEMRMKRMKALEGFNTLAKQAAQKI